MTVNLKDLEYNEDLMDVAIKETKKKSVKQVAELFGVTNEAIRLHIKKLYPTLLENGVKTMLDEQQITEIKKQMIPTSQLAGIQTDQEMIEKTYDVLSWLKGKLTEAQKENEILKIENTALIPKGNYYDLFMQRGNSSNLRDTAKQINVKERIFIEYLISQKYIYKNQKDDYRYYEGGNLYFEYKDYVNTKNGHTGKQLLVTPKGKQYFSEVLK